MDHSQNSYIIPNIQINLLPKDESSSSSSSSKLLINPRIHVDFSLKNLTLACSSSNNGWKFFSTNEQPLTFPTMQLILHDNFCYKESIWMALTYLGVQERFLDQVVETLEVKVGQVFTYLSDYVVEPGFVNEFEVHARVDILRVLVENGSPEFEVEDDGRIDDIMGWAAEVWPVDWLE